MIRIAFKAKLIIKSSSPFNVYACLFKFINDTPLRFSMYIEKSKPHLKHAPFPYDYEIDFTWIRYITRISLPWQRPLISLPGSTITHLYKVNKLRPRQIARSFPDGIFKGFILKKYFIFPFKSQRSMFLWVQYEKSPLVHAMTWCKST